MLRYFPFLFIALTADFMEAAEESLPVSFRQDKSSLEISIGRQVIAEYIFNDDQIRRPYFRHLRTLSGVQHRFG